MTFREPPKITNEGLIIEGDPVASMGSMEAIDEDGTTFKLSYCDIYTVKNGKLATIKSYAIPL